MIDVTSKKFRYGVLHVPTGLFVWHYSKTLEPQGLRIDGTFCTDCRDRRSMEAKKSCWTSYSEKYIVTKKLAKKYKLDKVPRVIKISDVIEDNIACEIYHIPRDQFRNEEIIHIGRSLIEYESKRTGLMMKGKLPSGRMKWVDVIEGDILSYNNEPGVVKYKNYGFYLVGDKIDLPLGSLDQSLLKIEVLDYRPAGAPVIVIKDGQLAGTRCVYD
jgi:hypothetical protein